MTLILSLGNKEQIVQISDRRLSCNGRIVDDESNKCGVLFCLNARLVFGYTGLAKWNDFVTSSWLMKALHDSASPEFTIGEILERLKIKATETFKTNPRLKQISREHKRLAVLFSGYINLGGKDRLGCAVLSNYHNFENNTLFAKARDEFNINYTTANKDELKPSLLYRLGSWQAMTKNEVDELMKLLIECKPHQAIIGKALEIVRDLSNRPLSRGTIGKQLTIIDLPSDPKKGVQSGYSSNFVKPETYLPALVYLLPNQHMTVENITISPVDVDTPPLSLPKVNKNAPCPCGSKMKYKYCHGRRVH